MVYDDCKLNANSGIQHEVTELTDEYENVDGI